jgi:hypothetical protein
MLEQRLAMTGDSPPGPIVVAPPFNVENLTAAVHAITSQVPDRLASQPGKPSPELLEWLQDASVGKNIRLQISVIIK